MQKNQPLIVWFALTNKICYIFLTSIYMPLNDSGKVSFENLKHYTHLNLTLKVSLSVW